MVVAYAYRSNGGAAVLGRGTLTSLLTCCSLSLPVVNQQACFTRSGQRRTWHDGISCYKIVYKIKINKAQLIVNPTRPEIAEKFLLIKYTSKFKCLQNVVLVLLTIWDLRGISRHHLGRLGFLFINPNIAVHFTVIAEPRDKWICIIWNWETNN